MLAVVMSTAGSTSVIEDGEAVASSVPGVAVRVMETATSTVAVVPALSVIVQRAMPVRVCGSARPELLKVVLAVAALVIVILAPPVCHAHEYR